MEGVLHMTKSVGGPLGGARIWLAGAIPAEFTDAEREAMREFLRKFAAAVFERGGSVIHGSHPTFVEDLLEQARLYRAAGGHLDRLNLAVSHRFARDLPLAQWREVALVHEIPEVEGQSARDESLQLLREFMAARCDAVVVVGGNWWKAVLGRSGVPLELELAMERGLPCFVLGGLGGAARDHLAEHPELLRGLRNGLDEGANRSLAARSDGDGLARDVCDQLERLPLVRGQRSERATFRILALDGGGLKGSFTAAVLAEWERATGRKIVEHFDLIAGTSTGGIIAIGLALGLPARDLLKFYRERGPTIFPVTRLLGRPRRGLQSLVKAKYSRDVLLQELVTAFGTSPLKDARCRLLIPSYYPANGTSHRFRTPHHPHHTGDANKQAAHVALATATAPTFFAAAKLASEISESHYLDGGVWANSPALAAIVEAIAFLQVPLERIDVLSVGTTEAPFKVENWQAEGGVLGWAWKGTVLELLLNAQQESSLHLARDILRGQPRFLRVNEVTQPGEFALDGSTQIEELASRGERAAGGHLALVKDRFLNGVPALPWESFSRQETR